MTKICYKTGVYFGEATFGNECNKDFSYMKMVKPDIHARLRDMIFRNDNKMARGVENVQFQQIIESQDLKDTFQIHGYLLKVQLK